MRKNILFLYIILFVNLISNAQIPNNSFEDWTNMGSYNNPDYWDTPNNMTSAVSTFTCTKGTPGTSGAAYIKLVSKTVPGMGVVPGIAVCGTADWASQQPESGFAFNSRPQALSGMWQYMASGNDQGFVLIALTKWNNSMMMRDTVAYAYNALSGMAMTWTNFSIPVNYLSGDDPDSAIIILSASRANNIPAVANSYLYVDELMFTGLVAEITEENSNENFSVTPNPARSNVDIDLSNLSSKPLSAEITDMKGRIVKTVNEFRTGSKSSINIDELPDGNYILKIITSSGILTKNFIKQ